MAEFLLSAVDTERPSGLMYVNCYESRDVFYAVSALFERGHKLERVLLLTALEGHQGDHGLYIEHGSGSLILTGGLTSGYTGEGPKTLSTLLDFFVDREIWPHERVVSRGFLSRAAHACLSDTDLTDLDRRYRSHPKGIGRLHISGPKRSRTIFGGRVPIPFCIIDERLVAAATIFHDDPDRALREGHRRLESIIRDRIRSLCPTPENLDRNRTYQYAFSHNEKTSSILTWPDLSRDEQTDRFNLFRLSQSMSRNPRVHSDAISNEHAFEEFMLLNLLFRLEADAESRTQPDL